MYFAYTGIQSYKILKYTSSLRDSSVNDIVIIQTDFVKSYGQ